MVRSYFFAVLILTVTAGSQEVCAETPRLLARTDWVGWEVLAAHTTGGPESIPRQLPGVWRVSLCVKKGMHRGHAWIRYENLHTGEVHTIGRFQKNVRPTRRRKTGKVLYAKTKQSGLYWDYDWRFEHEVRAGKYALNSVIVRNPIIFGHDDPYGHWMVRNNCITYARDAWHFYSGQRYDLALLHTPEGFLRTISHNRDKAEPSASRFADRPQLTRLPAID